jgi:hypothetical protein
MTKLYKIYVVSLNKVINNLLAAEYERFESVKQLLDVMDHLIFRWGKDLSSREVQHDSSKALERYFQQVLLWIINKALYFKRGGSSTNAIEILEGTKSLCETMKSSKYAETLNICGRFSLILGLLYLEVQLSHNALDILIEGIKCWSIEQKMRLKEFNRIAVGYFSPRVAYKIRRCLVFITIGIYNIGLAYEFLLQYTEALESYRMCKWYCNTEKEIFGSNISLSALKFITESSADEENKMLETLDMKVGPEKTEAPKKTNKIDDNDVQQIINLIWSRTAESREINERVKTNNFNTILNTIKGKDKQSNIKTANFQSFTERSTDEFTTKTTLPKSPPASRISIRTESKKKKQSLKSEQKMLDPDNFFKMKICSDLQIDSDWLDENDPRKRFRQDMIESIMKRESDSHKSLNILKDFLVTKGKDNMVKEQGEYDPKALQKTAFYEVGHKMHALQTDLATQNYPQVARTPTALYSARRRTIILKSPTSFYQEQFKGLVKEQEQKRVMTKLAEKLQRDINNLEMNIHNSKGKKKLQLNKKKEDNLSKEEIMKYQNLVNSITNRRVNIPQKRVIHRGNSTKSKFAK